MPASLLWLIAAWKRPTGRGHRTAPTVLALVVGLTVAQPFGVIASKKDAAPRPPVYAGNGHSVHVARVFGIPLLRFRLYSREVFWPGENTTTATLRARSWFWLPALTNATQIAETCSNDVLDPCWDPEPGSGTSGSDLTVFRDGGKQWVTIDNPDGRQQEKERGPCPPETCGAGYRPTPIPDSFNWELRAGIASPAGLVYWALAILLVISARLRRTGPTASHSAGAPPTPAP